MRQVDKNQNMPRIGIRVNILARRKCPKSKNKWNSQNTRLIRQNKCQWRSPYLETAALWVNKAIGEVTPRRLLKSWEDLKMVVGGSLCRWPVKDIRRNSTSTKNNLSINTNISKWSKKVTAKVLWLPYIKCRKLNKVITIRIELKLVAKTLKLWVLQPQIKSSLLDFKE